MNYTVKEQNVNERIDTFISSNNEKISRSLAQKLIENGQIKVNNGIVKTSYKLKLNDTVSVDENNLNTTSEGIEAEDIPVEVIFEDEDILVINKPKNMVVHPGSGVKNGTLVNAIVGKYKLSDGGESFRPGIIHRLDKDTTGVLVIAKNNYAHENISKQIKDRTTKKEYIALVKGIIKEEKGVIDMPIGRSPKDRKKMAIVKNGRNAYTEFNVINRYKEGYTLIKVILKTGRTHQIRVHMSSIGYPVVGDSTYSSGKNPFGVTSQMLHSHILGFEHPTKKKYMEFEAPIPEYFNKIIDSLTPIS